MLHVRFGTVSYGGRRKGCPPPLFRKRQFDPVIIVTCVRWSLRFPLSTPDIEALIAERGLAVDHTTI